MAGRRRTFCMECRKETAYALHKTLITKTIREKGVSVFDYHSILQRMRM